MSLEFASDHGRWYLGCCLWLVWCLMQLALDKEFENGLVVGRAWNDGRIGNLLWLSLRYLSLLVTGKQKKRTRTYFYKMVIYKNIRCWLFVVTIERFVASVDSEIILGVESYVEPHLTKQIHSMPSQPSENHAFEHSTVYCYETWRRNVFASGKIVHSSRHFRTAWLCLQLTVWVAVHGST